jgi:predicted O-methyltransferase YrrM
MNGNYKFTLDYFTSDENWTILLQKYINRPYLRFLELGSLEGRSAIWLLERVLTHPTSKIYCVDTWKEEVFYQNFLDNIQSFKKQIEIVKSTTDEAFQLLEKDPRWFDFIFIDADHEKESVKKDFINSLKFIHPLGIIYLDDWLYPSIRQAITELKQELKISFKVNNNGAWYEQNT